MDTQVKDHIVKNGFITTTVWREGNNLGMAFSRLGGNITWGDLKLSEKVEIVQNLYGAADFFSRLLGESKFTDADKKDETKKEQTKKQKESGVDNGGLLIP